MFTTAELHDYLYTLEKVDSLDVGYPYKRVFVPTKEACEKFNCSYSKIQSALFNLDADGNIDVLGGTDGDEGYTTVGLIE